MKPNNLNSSKLMNNIGVSVGTDWASFQILWGITAIYMHNIVVKLETLYQIVVFKFKLSWASYVKLENLIFFSSVNGVNNGIWVIKMLSRVNDIKRKNFSTMHNWVATDQ